MSVKTDSKERNFKVLPLVQSRKLVPIKETWWSNSCLWFHVRPLWAKLIFFISHRLLLLEIYFFMEGSWDHKNDLKSVRIGITSLFPGNINFPKGLQSRQLSPIDLWNEPWKSWQDPIMQIGCVCVLCACCLSVAWGGLGWQRWQGGRWGPGGDWEPPGGQPPQ